MYKRQGIGLHYLKLMEEIQPVHQKVTVLILLGHIGSGKAVRIDRLTNEINYEIKITNIGNRMRQKDVKEIRSIKSRQVRKIIQDLRIQGWLICSIACEGGGYFLANNMEEVAGFIENEYDKKIKSMQVSRSIVLDNAKKIFGNVGRQLDFDEFKLSKGMK